VCAQLVGGVETTDAERHAYELNQMVKARRAEELAKEEAAVGNLQTEGELTREQLKDFFARNAALLESAETRAKYKKLARTPEGLADLARIMVEQQQGVFLEIGVSRALGTGALHKLAQEDGELLGTVKAFAIQCGEAWIRAVRDNKPKKLQRSGRMTRLQIMNFAEGCVTLLQLPSTRAAMRAAYLEGGIGNKPHPSGNPGAAQYGVKLQRSLLSDMGLDPDFAVGQLNQMSSTHGKDREVMAKMQAFQEAAQRAVEMSQYSEEEAEVHEKELVKRKQQEALKQRKLQERAVQVQNAVKTMSAEDKAQIKGRMARKWDTLMRLPQQERMVYLQRQPDSDQLDFTMMSALMMEEKIKEAAEANARRNAKAAAASSK